MRRNRRGEFVIQTTNPIERLNRETHPEQLLYRHFRELRSGIDRFSRMTMEQLVATRDPNILEVCALLLPDVDDRTVASACRWAARGLRADLVVRKVAVDGSIAGAAIRKRVRDRFNVPRRMNGSSSTRRR